MAHLQPLRPQEMMALAFITLLLAQLHPAAAAFAPPPPADGSVWDESRATGAVDVGGGFKTTVPSVTSVWGPSLPLSLGAPPTRKLPLLSKQPAFCAKQFFTNYVWIAQAHLACLGIPSKGCGGPNPCGTLSINGHEMNVTNINNDDHDVCGSCEGCPTAFVGFPSSIPAAALAFEGKDAALVYRPPAAGAKRGTSADIWQQQGLPDCPALPSPWRTLVDKQLSPACSPYESQGSLGLTSTAEQCLAQAKASGVLNYAMWSTKTKSCDVCAIRWRGAAENWKFIDAAGVTSFAWYDVLPPPKPSGLCEPCPPDPSTTTGDAATVVTLGNELMQASFGGRGLSSLSSPTLNVSIGKDEFALGLDRKNCTCSSSLADPAIGHVSSNVVSFKFSSPAQKLLINVTYELRPQSAFISKTITLTDTSGTNITREVNSVSAMDGVALQSRGGPSVSTRMSQAVQFFRWNDSHAPATRTVGAFLTAQNQFVQPPSLGWGLDQNWTTLDAAGGAAARVLDSAIVGLYEGSTSQLELAEAAAVTKVVGEYLVQPSEEDATVKINIAWCENDYQLDISLPDDRASYKRIIDRAAEMGITHILFAPRNSDVSSKENNTDPWGWEQLLWFGYGQQIRMGQWKPGDPLAASTQEMLDYFKEKHIKPVAYVYPILAFLAGTMPGGGDPSWITQGTYMSDHDRSRYQLSTGHSRSQLAGVLRSNLANEEFIQWLPETMLAFAEQTGAGGFSFDLTYWEEHLPVASEYSQWAGWRSILSRLTTGKACAGSRCVVDNRQANHGWGAWMWALGGTYAEPLMSDEQPASWEFYEPDLHTDRLAGNKQRSVARQYRAEYCPNDALPGFAFHQTDRDPTALQNGACPGPEGRCSNHSRVRDFDLLGYRYSLLSSIGTGGLNNVLNMLPARDEQEFKLFPQEDLSFVSDWLKWADDNVGLLKLTRPVPSLATPGPGQADGTIMLRSDNTGAMFLFNPTSREINVSLPLSGAGSAALGFTCGAAAAPVLIRQIASSERTAGKPFALEVLDCSGGILNLTLPATSARVLAFERWNSSSATTAPVVIGSPCSKAELDATGATLTVSGAVGESGTTVQLVVVLPTAGGHGASKVKTAVINGERTSSFIALPAGSVYGRPAIAVEAAVWAGTRFRRAQEILPIDTTGTGTSVEGGGGAAGGWRGWFSVPPVVMEQLRARNSSYPIQYNTNPLDSNDADVAWLAPGRLLIFVKYSTPLDDTLNITGEIDGQPLRVRKAYNTIVRNPGRFIGHWADVTLRIRPGKQQVLTLELPPGHSEPTGVFFENTETVFTDKVQMAPSPSYPWSAGKTV